MAARQGPGNTFCALMLAGADPNVLDSQMQSPLHLTADAGYDVMVHSLLLSGALPDAKVTDTKQTALSAPCCVQGSCDVRSQPCGRRGRHGLP